jgi:hypothetical protein
MLKVRGSCGLHTVRRVQLAVWLPTTQEWVGIAGVTICEYKVLCRISQRMTSMDAPSIFCVAGFDTRKLQWISSLNNISAWYKYPL